MEDLIANLPLQEQALIKDLFDGPVATAYDCKCVMSCNMAWWS